MSRILFITDNVWIYSNIKTYLEGIDYSSNIDFRCSSISSPLSNVLEAISVKNDCDFIIKHYTLVFSAHCLQFFPKSLIENVKCINIHPGYNPINRGWYPQVFSIIHNLSIGATIHEMDSKLDNGPIIARELVPKYLYDTSEDIYKRVLNTELKLFREWFLKILKNEYILLKPEKNFNYFSKADFEALCQLNLDERLTMGEALNKLRALTHGDYNNAFFIDPESGKKVFMSIRFKILDK